VEGNQFPKAKLVRKKNDEDTEEAVNIQFPFW
jgi:hypothetical protein